MLSVVEKLKQDLAEKHPDVDIQTMMETLRRLRRDTADITNKELRRIADEAPSVDENEDPVAEMMRRESENPL